MGRTHNIHSNLPESKAACFSPGGSAARVSDALSALSGRWKVEILFSLLACQTCRYSELERNITGISQKMLAQQLRELERDGLINRHIYPEIPPKVEYSLTELGQSLRVPLRMLREIGVAMHNRE
ncbi:winged helix-turn-helix transcriptional regulator [Thalassospira mesophila]|uniref:winged helix-turn-helix transcriptional regulator n=1 Tax=Thalassospira mesophila TaxID=1293891 RepID=UPI000A1FE879|nr:helix-turn-helix domain-containing protein [Thalassospira mesophila]